MPTNPPLGFDSNEYTSEGEFYRSNSPEQLRLDEKRNYAFGGGLLKGITELPLELLEMMSPADEYVPGALAPDQSSPRQRLRTERLHGEQYYESLKEDPDTTQAAEVGYGTSFVVDPIIDTGIGLAPHLIKGFKAISKGERAAPKLANLMSDEIGAVGDIAYHGTDQDVRSFDPEKFGSATGAKSAKQGVWVVSDPNTAHGYADFAAFNRPVAQKLKLADEAEKAGDWDKYDDYLREAEELEVEINDQRRRGQNIIPLKYEGDYKTVDMGGSEFMERQDEINQTIATAKREGKDGVIFQNLSDDAGFSNRPAEHTVVFDPKNLKSVYEPIPVDLSKQSLSEVFSEARAGRMERATEQGFDIDEPLYHGSGDISDFSSFDPAKTGKGADQYGSGFYLTTSPQEASGYAMDIDRGQGKFKSKNPGVVQAYSNMKNYIDVDPKTQRNLDDVIDLDSSQVRKMLDKSDALKRGMDDEDMNPAGDHFDSFWNDGVEDWMLDDLAETYAHGSPESIEAELFDGDSEAFRRALGEATGMQGLRINFDEGLSHVIPWFPENIRSVNAQFDPAKSKSGELLATAAGASVALSAANSGEPVPVDMSKTTLREVLNK